MIAPAAAKARPWAETAAAATLPRGRCRALLEEEEEAGGELGVGVELEEARSLAAKSRATREALSLRDRGHRSPCSSGFREPRVTSGVANEKSSREGGEAESSGERFAPPSPPPSSSSEPGSLSSSKKPPLEVEGPALLILLLGPSSSSAARRWKRVPRRGRRDKRRARNGEREEEVEAAKEEVGAADADATTSRSNDCMVQLLASLSFPFPLLLYALSREQRYALGPPVTRPGKKGQEEGTKEAGQRETAPDRWCKE